MAASVHLVINCSIRCIWPLDNLTCLTILVSISKTSAVVDGTIANRLIFNFKLGNFSIISKITTALLHGHLSQPLDSDDPGCTQESEVRFIRHQIDYIEDIIHNSDTPRTNSNTATKNCLMVFYKFIHIV